MGNIIHHYIIIVVICLSLACSNTQPSSETLLNQAKQNADAILNKDYEKAVRFMHPAIVEEMGGFQKTLIFVKASMFEMESNGMAIIKIQVGQPSTIVKEGRENVAVVPTEMEMKIENKKVKINSYLVAVTQNNGSNWYFFDGTQMPKEKLAQIYPKLVATVKIPEQKNSLISEINETLSRIEKREGKPIIQVLDEQLAESKQVIKKIEENSLRQYIEKREGKKLEQIPTVRIKELLLDLKIE